MTIPSERVHDVFRRKSGGKVSMSTNSKPATDNFHIDRSRLGVHEEYDPDVPNDWGGTGKYVEAPNSIMDNVRGAVGGICAKSSYKSVHEPAAPTSGPNSVPCCAGEYRPENQPILRRRGDK
jgi:hypothetical protein